MSSIKLIVGLANPGAEYAATRHNAGAWYLDLLAERHNQSLKEEPKFYGYTARISLAGNDVRLLVPATFMNLSGKAVAAMATFTALRRRKFWSPMMNLICCRESLNSNKVAVMADITD